MLSYVNPAFVIATLCAQFQRKRFETSPWHNTSDRSMDDAIFIGGCGRSGTTLLREILNRHGNIAWGPETWLFVRDFNAKYLATAWQLDLSHVEQLHRQTTSVVRFAEQFFRNHARREGKKRWGDKSPGNIRVLPQLLRMFPNARFIHMVRDGRDVVCSRRTHPKEKIINSKVVSCTTNNPIDACATYWSRDVSAGLAYQDHPRCLEVRYERLVCEAEGELRRICAFINEPYSPEMLRPSSSDSPSSNPYVLVDNRNATGPIQPSPVGRWLRELTVPERKTFDFIAGELLIALGYEGDHEWVYHTEHWKSHLNLMTSPVEGHQAA